ncbi:hypothetical protein ACFYVL_43705 [Streptomyces sp. NPDC004111]|uniref:hypothetical protein n=1 Tax=Streptomyces sp. NPDC004111 TaxID=3364690 RepID=UPI0036BB9171
MPPTPPAPGSVRPAAVVNEDIRALWSRADERGLRPADERRYQDLLIEWADAVRAELIKAA